MILRVSAWIEIVGAMILLGVHRDIDRNENYVWELSFWDLKDSKTSTSRVFTEEWEWGGGKASRNEVNV